MKRRELRLSRPLYEGLPWIYMLGGILALAASYRHRAGRLSTLVGVLGILAVISGIVVLLRRRGFRDMRAHYQDSDSKL